MTYSFISTVSRIHVLRVGVIEKSTLFSQTGNFMSVECLDLFPAALTKLALIIIQYSDSGRFVLRGASKQSHLAKISKFTFLRHCLKPPKKAIRKWITRGEISFWSTLVLILFSVCSWLFSLSYLRINRMRRSLRSSGLRKFIISLFSYRSVCFR